MAASATLFVARDFYGSLLERLTASIVSNNSRGATIPPPPSLLPPHPLIPIAKIRV